MNTFLNLLESNKKYPYYAAEKRIDLLINYYLDDILNWKFNRPTNFVAPEFPLKHSNNSQSDNVDYLSVFSDTQQPIFVELKTDSSSFKKEQAEKYIKNKNWAKIVEDLKAIIIKSTNTDYRIKYFYLLEKLSFNDLITFDNNTSEKKITKIKTLTSTTDRKEKSDRSKLIIDLAHSIKPKWMGDVILVYIIPADEVVKTQLLNMNEFVIIDMKEIAKNVKSNKIIELDFVQLFNYLKTI